MQWEEQTGKMPAQCTRLKQTNSLSAKKIQSFKNPCKNYEKYWEEGRPSYKLCLYIVQISHKKTVCGKNL